LRGVLRLGIPRRADGVVRIEAQHGGELPPGETLDRSLAALR